MRGLKFQFGTWLVLLLLGGLAGKPALARRDPGRHPHPDAQKPAQNKSIEKKNRPQSPTITTPKANQGQQPNARGMMGVPPKWVERLREMSPEEQERFMRNNAHFQNLPSDRQTQIRENLRRWNQLSPAERNAIRDRERVWEQMSPEQRTYVRNQLLPKWQQLPAERRQLLLDRLRTLRGLSPSQREARLNDEGFLRGLDPNERQILHDLNNLRGAPTP
jgi:hypothetical protein